MGTIAVVGLGSMGKPIAQNLLAAGHSVVVWNRSRPAVEELVAAGATEAASPGEAFETGLVLSVLANDRAVREAILDSDALSAAPPGTVHANLATVSTGLARAAVDTHSRRGIGYVASPVFGRPDVAAAGRLNILAAGRASLIDKLEPYFEVIGAKTWRLGPKPEHANVVKILGNYLLVSAIQSLSEAISVAEAADVEPEALIEVLSGTLFPGPVYSGYGALIARREYQPTGFSTTLGLKDLDLAFETARLMGFPLPIGDVLREVLVDTIATGHGNDDWSSMAERQRALRTGVDRGLH